MLPLRLLASTTAVGALALTGLTASPAQAAEPPLVGSLFLEGSLNFDGDDCTGDSNPDGIGADLVPNGTVSRTLSVDGTATATGDETDRVRFRGTQKLTVSSKATSKQVTSVIATSTISGSTSATKAETACAEESFAPATQNEASFAGVIQRTTAGWLRLRVTGTGYGAQSVEGGIQGNGPTAAAQVQFGSISLRDVSHDQWIYVPAGEYNFVVTVGGVSSLDFDIPKVSLKQTVSFSFHPAGVAKGGAVGAARTRVALPNALTCSTGRATVRLTSKVRGASRVLLYVNGVRKAVINRPTARLVTLKGVPTNRAVTLKAVVVDGRHSTGVTRSYRSC